jgi:hypothetical protein
MIRRYEIREDGDHFTAYSTLESDPRLSPGWGHVSIVGQCQTLSLAKASCRRDYQARHRGKQRFAWESTGNEVDHQSWQALVEINAPGEVAE